MAVERIRINQQGVGNKHFKAYQFWEALSDPMVWAFVFYSLVADIPNGGISNFFSQLIVSFGFTPKQSLLLGIPGGAIEVIALVVAGWLGDKFRNRLLICTWGLLISMMGMLLIICLDHSHDVGRLIGYYCTQASPTPFVALLSLVSTNIAGWTKKTTVAAMYLIGYCVGNIIGPQTFKSSDAPAYHSAYVAMLVGYIVKLVAVVVLYVYMYTVNKKRDREAAAAGVVNDVEEEKQAVERGMHDVTELDNPGFRYTL
jgi:ACS family allantoate permease-like MFS transporter